MTVYYYNWGSTSLNLHFFLRSLVFLPQKSLVNLFFCSYNCSDSRLICSSLQTAILIDRPKPLSSHPDPSVRSTTSGTTQRLVESPRVCRLRTPRSSVSDSRWQPVNRSASWSLFQSNARGPVAGTEQNCWCVGRHWLPCRVANVKVSREWQHVDGTRDRSRTPRQTTAPRAEVDQGSLTSRLFDRAAPTDADRSGSTDDRRGFRRERQWSCFRQHRWQWVTRDKRERERERGKEGKRGKREIVKNYLCKR